MYKRDGNGGSEKPTQVKAPSKEVELKKLIHDDVILWGQYGDVNFILKEVCYHNKCVSTYEPPSKRETHQCIQGVYESLYKHIETFIIKEQKLMTTEDVYIYFEEEFDETATNIDIPSRQKVIQCVMNHFRSKIKLYHMRPHQLMYSAALNEDDVQIIYRNKSSAKDDIESTKTAQYLKKMCFEVKRNAAPLPIVLTYQHFKEGQAPVPIKLIKFYLELIATDPAKSQKDRCQTAGWGHTSDGECYNNNTTKLFNKEFTQYFFLH